MGRTQKPRNKVVGTTQTRYNKAPTDSADVLQLNDKIDKLLAAMEAKSGRLEAKINSVTIKLGLMRDE